MILLKPVPTGSTKTRSENASQDSSFWTSRGGIGGSVPSAGKSTRWGPTAPTCKYADDAPGPPLNTNVTGRSRARLSATYETEKISADGFSFLRRTSHFAVAAYEMSFHVPVDAAPRGGSWSSFVSARSSSLMQPTLYNRGTPGAPRRQLSGLIRSTRPKSSFTQIEPKPTPSRTGRPPTCNLATRRPLCGSI